MCSLESLNPKEIPKLRGCEVFDSVGVMIGHIDGLYSDKKTHRIIFFSLITDGAPPKTQRFICPVAADVALSEKRVRLPYKRSFISNAPQKTESEKDTISDQKKREIFHYYGVDESDIQKSRSGDQLLEAQRIIDLANPTNRNNSLR